MNRWLAGLVGVTGVGAIGAGLVLAVALTPVTASEAGGGALLLVLTGVTVAAVKLSRSSAGGAAIAPPPWDEDGGLVDGTPEETADPADVTGDELAALVDDARERAREAETVEEGFAVVRPPLRDALTRVLVADGTAPDDVDEALATGAWTDDPVAAAVVDERVDLPRVSLRQRLRAWLFPERVVRRGTARAVAAVDGAAEREVLNRVLPDRHCDVIGRRRHLFGVQFSHGVGDRSLLVRSRSGGRVELQERHGPQ